MLTNLVSLLKNFTQLGVNKIIKFKISTFKINKNKIMRRVYYTYKIRKIKESKVTKILRAQLKTFCEKYRFV